MFEFGKNIFLGIDVGTSIIKMVEIKVSDGRPVLSNYAWMPLDKTSSREDVSSDYFSRVLPQYLKRIIKEAHFKSKNAYVAIPAFGGLVTLINFPEMEEKDMEQAVKFEAHKYIPSSLDEVVLSWDIINKEKGKIQVLLVAASKNKVLGYEKMVESAGLKLRSMEIESFSMVTSLIGNDQGQFIIADIGSRVCNIILVKKGIVKANRNIDAGGGNITATIAKSLGIEEERAERLKVSGRNFFNSESFIEFPVLKLIFNEIVRIINSLGKDSKNDSGEAEKIDGIVLSGGTANLAGIGEYFTQSLKIKTIVGNPFSRVKYDPKFEPAIRKIRTHFSVSVGLALKGASEYINKNKN